MELEYQDRSGIEQDLELRPSTYERVRLTIPAREALQAANALIVTEANDAKTGASLYTVTLSAQERVPVDLIAGHIAGTDHTTLRLSEEEEYPHEIPMFWEQVDFSGCPKCGKPLIWWEAGYVPGYRVCSGRSHHHVIAK